MWCVNASRFGHVVALAAAVLGILAAGAGASWAALPAWTTYRHDALRSGMDPDSISALASGPVQAWQTPTLDGEVYGEPLVYGSRVFVATENDTVYALDAATGAIIWQRHLATAVPWGQLPCGDIGPVVGITSTPVIDPSTGAIYVVADTWDGSDPSSIHHELFGVTLADGTLTPGLPVGVDPPGTDPPAQLQRPGLALDQGKVIMGFGGNAGDCDTYHGWLAAMSETGGALQTFEVEPGSGEWGGAVWGSGNAPPVDAAGDVWASSGNGFGSDFGYQESVLKLDPNLNLLDFWAPTDWATLDANDTDLGSSEPVLLPDGLVFEIGKQGVGDLLSASSLGGLDGTPVYEADVCGGSWGGGIYYGGVIYVTCRDGLHALSLDTTTRTFAPLASWSVNGDAIGPPIEAAGLIWSASDSTGTLYGLDPQTGATSFSADLGEFERFASPGAGGGRLFVGNGSQVTAFSIATPAPPSATTTALVSSANPAAAGEPVSFTATVSPAPDAGTVSFTADGAPISGCTNVGLGPATGRAGCTTTFGQAATHTMAARYSGDPYYLGSSSGPLSQVVASSVPGGGAPGPVAPRLSRARVTVHHGRVVLSVVLSEAARIALSVNRVVRGRRVAGRCRAHARHGRRCSILPRLRTLKLRGRSGHNTFRLRMRRLRHGNYRLGLVATNPAGQRSRRVTVSFAVPA